MASKLTGSDITRIGIQTDADSIPLDDNYQNLKNKTNEIIDELAVMVVPPAGSEVSDARPYHTSLKNRLDSIWSGQANYLKEGGVVTLNSGLWQVDVSAGSAKIAGIDVDWVAQSSGVIAFTAANTRYDVVVINSDNTLTVVTGTEHATPVLPAIATTQKALWVLLVGTASVALNHDARDQGCWYNNEGRYKYAWKIQTAIDDITSGDIRIGKGTYYETLTYKSGVNLIFEGGATIYNAGGVKQGDVDNTKILGEIIAIHPDVKAAFLPNDYEYAPCDGVADLPTTIFDTGNDTKVPDLTDDRFLMGDSLYETGGSNTADHLHQWGHMEASQASLRSIESPDYATRTFTTASYWVISKVATTAVGGIGLRTHFADSSPQPIYTGGAIDNTLAAADNKPQYFSVIYYMRIR